MLSLQQVDKNGWNILFYRETQQNELQKCVFDV